MKISVAMATYNGAPFLRDQLDSIARQTLLPAELVVRDDGSRDSTRSILEDFAQSAPFPVRILGDGENLGFADNFLTAASQCQGDWIAFCDQDDVWLPEKLERCAREILEENNDDLLMVVHQARVVDQTLNPTGRFLSNISKRRLCEPGSLYGFWMLGGIVLIVRADVVKTFDWRERPPDPGGSAVLSHDFWVCMLTHAIGRILLLPDCLILYRRHGSTITGAYAPGNFRNTLVTAASTGAEHYRYLAHVATEAARIFLDLASKTENAVWSRRLRERAAGYEQIARIQRTRARLYSATGLGERLAVFFTLFRDRQTYFGNPVWAIGGKALVKDIVALLMPHSFKVKFARTRP